MRVALCEERLLLDTEGGGPSRFTRRTNLSSAIMVKSTSSFRIRMYSSEVLWRFQKSQFKLVSTCVLMDSWVMRRSLIELLTADDGAYHLTSAD